MDITALYKIFLECTSVTTDSRNCPEGSLFIALKGDNFNGNAFAAKALESGSAYVIIDEAEYALAGDSHYILVNNCLHTLQELANYHLTGPTHHPPPSNRYTYYRHHGD